MLWRGSRSRRSSRLSFPRAPTWVPLPPADLPTVAIHRLLLARNDVSSDVVYWIEQILMERRHDLAAAIPDAAAVVRPLVAHSSQPVLGDSLGANMHPGAASYFNHDQGSFVSQYPD